MPTKLLTALLSVLIFCSCHTPRYIYSPSNPNNPMFHEKGESKLAAYYSGTDNNPRGHKNIGYDLQGAYAISDHFAVTASYFNRRERDIYDSTHGTTPNNYNYFNSSRVNYKRNLVEFGAGVFEPLNQRHTIYFSLYGGLGFGKFYIKDDGIDKNLLTYTRFHNANVFKYYFMPSLYFGGEHVKYHLGLRFSGMHYSKIETSYTDPELNYFKLNAVPGRTLFFIEPVSSLQFTIPKCDWLRIELGITFSSDPDKEDAPKARNVCPSIGLL
ncbi:MAG: hypothetical protein ABI480_14850, partial [Chitinophagaceae bacterium]